jgi:hypothetical protein
MGVAQSVQFDQVNVIIVGVVRFNVIVCAGCSEQESTTPRFICLVAPALAAHMLEDEEVHGHNEGRDTLRVGWGGGGVGRRGRRY